MFCKKPIALARSTAAEVGSWLSTAAALNKPLTSRSM